MQTVTGNTEDLEQLHTVIEEMERSVLQPLKAWTGEVPSELTNLIEWFCEYGSYLCCVLAHSF